MNLEELINTDLRNKKILVLGRAGAGKTWLSNKLNDLDHKIIHTDNYIEFAEPMAIEAIIEDEADIRRYYNAGSIIEGMLVYPLLLQGAKEKSYRPDIIIEVDISMGKQREIYLKERDSGKIKYQRRFYEKCLSILNEYHRLVPKEEQPTWITLNNEW